MGFVICSSSGPQNTPAMVSELLPGSLTVSLPLKIYPAPKEKETSLPTILFQGRTVNLGGVSYLFQVAIEDVVQDFMTTLLEVVDRQTNENQPEGLTRLEFRFNSSILLPMPLISSIKVPLQIRIQSRLHSSH